MKVKDANRQLMIMALAAVAIVGLVVWGASAGMFSATGQATGVPPTTAPPTPGEIAQLCPNTLSTAVTITQYNHLNDQTSESYDQTARIYRVQSDGSEALTATVSDLTAGEVTLNCGELYRLRLETEAGKAARIDGIRSGERASVSSNGRHVEFQPVGAVYNLEFDSPKLGDIVVRAFDNNLNGFVFSDASGSATAYVGSGATFLSTVDNTTAMAIGASDSLNLRFDMKANGSTADARDFSLLVLVDASTNVWEEPVLFFQGQELREITGELDTFERRAFSDYDYVYRITTTIEDRDRRLEFTTQPISGVNPGSSDDIEIAFAVSGASKQTSGNAMRYAATTDASSPQPILPLQTFTLNIQ